MKSNYIKPKITFMPLNLEENIAASAGKPGVRVIVLFDEEESPAFDKHVPESGLSALLKELDKLFGKGE